MSWIKRVSSSGAESYVNTDTLVIAEARELSPGSGVWYATLRATISYTNVVYLDGSYPSQADAEDALRRLVNGTTLAVLTA